MDELDNEMNINPNHPCFGGRHNGEQYARQVKAQRRQNLVAKIETFLGLMTLMFSIIVAAWMGEHNTPGWIYLPVFFCMIGFSLALLMENWEK